MDGNPLERCGLQCDIGQLFCDKHLPFPDLGRKAAMYADLCLKEDEVIHLDRFAEWAYPGSKEKPQIFDIAKYALNMRKLMSE